MTADIDVLHLGELRIAVQRIGHSPAPLVILHGLGDSSIISFHRIATNPALNGRAALLIDLPGFGYSSAPDTWPATIEAHADAVAGVLDALGISGTPVFGHSMGGSVALLLAHRHPDHVARLVLAEPLLHRSSSELGKSIARRSEMEFVQRGFDMLQLATRRQALRGEPAAIGFREPIRHADAAIMHRSAVSLLADRAPTFLDILETLPMPRTLIAGDRTQVQPELVPGSLPLHRVVDAGHSMMSEAPDALAWIIGEVLQGNGGSP